MIQYFTDITLFNNTLFRGLMAVLVSFSIVLITTPYFIAKLKVQNAYQSIRKEGPQSHYVKRETPTMGGIIILLAVLLSCILFGNITNQLLLLILFVYIGFAFIGFLDDVLKHSRKTSSGLSARQKITTQTIVVLLFCYLWLYQLGGTASLHFPIDTGTVWQLGGWYFLWTLLVIVGSSNAVNLTDGLDGLAMMPIVLVIGALGLMAYHSGTSISGSNELIIFCGAVVGSGLGFLWFNTHPAQLFMGDVGSLSLGASLGAIAIMLKQEFIFALMGMVFVVEALSVIIQVISFKLTKKRVFKMSPIHHHFELLGYNESKIVIRFWIITVLLVLIGFAIFMAR